MGNEIDIFNPTVTKVVEGIQGKLRFRPRT